MKTTGDNYNFELPIDLDKNSVVSILETTASDGTNLLAFPLEFCDNNLENSRFQNFLKQNRMNAIDRR